MRDIYGDFRCDFSGNVDGEKNSYVRIAGNLTAILHANSRHRDIADVLKNFAAILARFSSPKKSHLKSP